VAKYSDDKEGMVKKALARWMAYQNKKDNVIMAIDKWKKYTAEQARLKESLKKLCNFVEQRQLHKGFTRWRVYNSKAREAFKGYTKDELVEEYGG